MRAYTSNNRGLPTEHAWRSSTAGGTAQRPRSRQPRLWLVFPRQPRGPCRWHVDVNGAISLDELALAVEVLQLARGLSGSGGGETKGQGGVTYGQGGVKEGEGGMADDKTVVRALISTLEPPDGSG